MQESSTLLLPTRPTSQHDDESNQNNTQQRRYPGRKKKQKLTTFQDKVADATRLLKEQIAKADINTNNTTSHWDDGPSAISWWSSSSSSGSRSPSPTPPPVTPATTVTTASLPSTTTTTIPIPTRIPSPVIPTHIHTSEEAQETIFELEEEEEKNKEEEVIFAPTQTITESDIDRLHNERIESVNGNYDSSGSFQEWHETLRVQTYGGEELLILPYTVIDF